jgi:hypothetical protein
MRSQHEVQVFSTVLKNFPNQEEYLIDTSNETDFITASGELLSWKDIRLPKLSACGSFFDGSYTLQKGTYDDWIAINKQPCLLTPFITNNRITVISQQQCDQLLQRYTWDVFIWLTRPGFSQDFSQAIMRMDCYCSSGPPQCGSLLYLERTDKGWEQKSSHGLYNQ